ncbi:Zn-ribbon domain-containing OB-fold protein [Sphingobium tyrosinilyticum]|uniref:Zn-ribbon domain-containing OB-fold protein n=1 Tax=Sphingobium tyrosinilyticum TaxID=2715436 RepID=A0ABV9F2L6_9SPHN
MSDIAPLITGDPDAPFWTAWKDDERFLLHRCGICGRSEWPATCCPDHGMAAMQWVEGSGRGAVDTFTIFHRAYTAELAAEVPYSLIVIRLDEGPYFHSRLVDADLSALKTGLRVRLRRDAGDDFPLFVPE